jgi:threonyl-tRNA synthetase
MSPEELSHLRHSCAHLLAAAVEKLYPGVKRTIGPAIETGFYYDFDFGATKIVEADLAKIEKTMHNVVQTWKSFSHREVTVEEAREFFKDNSYKLELIEEFAKSGQTLTLYTSGDFTDLCRGGHCEHPSKELQHFKLLSIAGAYWRGDSEKAMLTRIYGTCFPSKEELEAHLKMLEEAKERDHRKLGKELKLFTFSPLVGSGLPIWLPHGATLRRVLERFVVDTELAWDYLHVYTPDIAKLDLYKTSGHYPYYKDSMYAPIKIDEDEFMLRPMTCPHHFQVYADSPRSYRELPMRIAELAKLYRYEASGELTGLVRVRGFCLADAHIVCADEQQAKKEVTRALDLIEYMAGVFGLVQGKNFWYRLSLGDRADDKKYYKNDAAWNTGEQVLREVLSERSCTFFEAPQEAAFYGPKIDIQMKDARGKENTAFTVQYDFCMPDRFNLEYTDSEGKKARPIVIHRSSIGAIERIVAFLIELYAGAFPVWLAPVQVQFAPVSAKHVDAVKVIAQEFAKAGVRVAVDDADETIGNKVRKAVQQKIPYIVVLGDRDLTGELWTIKVRGQEEQLKLSKQDFLERVVRQDRERN